MNFIKKIREEILQKNQYEMYKMLGFYDVKSYQDFENSKRAVNIKKLVKLWRSTGLTGDEFMKMIEDDVNNAT